MTKQRMRRPAPRAYRESTTPALLETHVLRRAAVRPDRAGLAARADLVRAVPAADACPGGGAARHDPAARHGLTEIHLGDLRRGGIGRRALAGRAAVHPRLHGRRAARAPHLRRQHLRGRLAADPRVPGCGDPQLPRSARRPAARRDRAVPRRPGELGPAGAADRPGAGRARALRGAPDPGRAWCGPGHAAQEGQHRGRGLSERASPLDPSATRTSRRCWRSRPPVRRWRSRSCSSTPTITSRSSNVRAGPASRSRSCPASCRSRRPPACAACWS